MKIIITKNYKELSRKAADMIIKEIYKKPDLLICAATGASPKGAYKLLAQQFKKTPAKFKKIRIIKLDEWGGLTMNDPATCETYLRKYLIRPLKITEDRYFTFKSNPEEPGKECIKIRKTLKREGPIDLCILGLGLDGHLGLNEPAEKLKPHAHINKLKKSTLKHKMLNKAEGKAKYGITLGMDDILSSKKILLLASGSGKKDIFLKMLDGKITNKLPASLIRKHINSVCLSDIK